MNIWKNWWRARNFPDEIFPLSIILYFCDHGIKSGLRPMLNCIFHTAISCWYAVSCIPKWTPYFLENDSVTEIWFLFRLIHYFLSYNWPFLTSIWPQISTYFSFSITFPHITSFVLSWCWPWNSSRMFLVNCQISV